MIRYVLLLLGAHLRLLYNGFRRARIGAKIGWMAAGLVLLGGAALSALAGYGLARLPELLQRQAAMPANVPLELWTILLQSDSLLRAILSVLVLAVWGIVLLGSLGAALSNFYLSSDLDLLVAAPIPMRAIFAAKFLEGLGLGYLLLFALGGPALIGLGLGAGYTWPYFLGAVLLLILLPLLPESLGTLLVMPLVRVIPPKRLREVLQALGALVGAGFYFFSQVAQGGRIDPQTAGRVVQWLGRLHLPFLPQGWAAHGLVALGEGQYSSAVVGLGGFLILSLGAYALCLFAAERLYYSGWANLQTAPPTARPRRARRARPAGELRFLPRPMQGILLKDLRLFFRDPQRWTQFLMPLAVYAFFLWQAGRGELAGRSGGALGMLASSGLVVLLCTSILSSLGLGGVGSEGRQFWVLQSAPVSPQRILWAKFWASYVPYLLAGGLMLLGLMVIGGESWALFLGNWLLLALIGLGITSIGVGLGASFPRMDAVDRRRVVSTGAGCVYFPIIFVYTLVIAALVLVPPLLNGILVDYGLFLLAWIIWGVGIAGAIGLTALAVWLPLRIGAERLALLEG